MAASLPAPARAPAPGKFTCCLLCQHLCLCPTILSCGHVVCRKCLRQILNAKGRNNAVCPSCGNPLPQLQGQTISQLADQLGRDLVLESLVRKELTECQVHCVVCNSTASKICLDCGDVYCDSCSTSHQKMSISKDHLQQDLFRVRPYAPPLPSRDSIPKGFDADTRPRPVKDRDALRLEARLCEKKVTGLEDIIAALERNVHDLLEETSILENHRQLLKNYSAHLARADDVMVAHARAMLSRVRRIRQDCHPPTQAALTRLAFDIKNLPTSGRGHFDPVTSVPRRTFVVDYPGSRGPLVSIAVTGSGQLVMVDQQNRTIIIAELARHARANVLLNVDTTPRGIAVLGNNEVCVTASEKKMYFVNTASVCVSSRVKTVREYYGVASLVDFGTLIVTCITDSEGPARVDVITRAGETLTTIVDKTSIPELNRPLNLCLMSGQVVLCDLTNHALYRVALDTRHHVRGHPKGSVDKRTHPELKDPLQVVSDIDGNCYVVSIEGQCVLVLTPGGQWLRLLYGPEDGEGERVKPFGLCLTSTGVVVTWYGKGVTAVVAGYDLI